jgi:DNA repair exonuclease SbcCD ATPase subunit
MRIISVKLQNVFRFGEIDNFIDFDELFSDDVSVAMISGATNGDENLSNGAGKSSIGEAIYWAFFEKLPRLMDGSPDKQGTAKEEIIRKNDDNSIPDDVRESFVELHFETKDGDRWRLKRGRKITKSKNMSAICELHNLTTDKSHAGSSKQFEQAISKIVRANWQSFLNGTFFAQNHAGRFLSGTDTDRKDILMDLRGVKVIDDMIAVLRNSWKKDCAQSITANDAKIEILQSRVSNSSPDMLRKAKMEAATKLVALESEISAQVEKEKLAQQALSASQVAKQAAQSSLEAARKALFDITASGETARNEAEAKVKGANEALYAAKERFADAMDVLDSMKKRLAKAEQCVMSITDASIAERTNAVADAKKRKAIVESEMSAENETIGSLKAEAIALKESIASQQLRISRVVDLMNGEKVDGGVSCDKCGSQLTEEKLTSEKIACESELARLEASKPILDGKYKTASANLAKLQAELKTLSSAIADETSLASDVERLRAAKEEISTSAAARDNAEKTCVSAELGMSEMKQKVEAARAAQIALVSRRKIELQVYNQDIDKAALSVTQSEVAVTSAQSAFDMVKTEMRGLMDRKTNLHTEINVADERIVNMERDTDELKALTDESAVLSDRMAKIMYFDKLLSTRIKVQAAETCVPLIAHYANEFLAILKSTARISFGSGDGDLAVKLVGASAPTFALLSGGEKEAVRLATNMALSMLTLGGTADLPDMIFLDEIFAPLDVSTKDNVFTLLARLNKHFKRIAVIAHDQGLRERFNSSIMINKVDGKSEIVKRRKVNV